MPTRRARATEPSPPGIVGVARVDRRSRELARRLKPGDIAVIDHLDLDRVSAEALAAGAAAVVNASPSTSGRYPNLGPEVLLAAGIPLVDAAGGGILTRVRDGEPLRLHEGVLYRVGDDEVLGSGRPQTADSVRAAMADARAGLAAQLQAFAATTAEYLQRDADLLMAGRLPESRWADRTEGPALSTTFQGRHVVVVVQGYDTDADLARLRRYLRDRRPVLVGVDEGADALVAAGYRPDMIIGDMLAVSDRTLRGGAELVVHARPDGDGLGRQRLEHLGLPAHEIRSSGRTEDLALLLSSARGAALVVTVGSSATMLELLDRGEMASSVLARLRVGGTLVDARAASELHRSRLGLVSALLLVLAGLVAVLLAVAATPVGEQLLGSADWWSSVTRWWQGTF